MPPKAGGLPNAGVDPKAGAPPKAGGDPKAGRDPNPPGDAGDVVAPPPNVLVAPELKAPKPAVPAV